jgi:hypothetical protein
MQFKSGLYRPTYSTYLPIWPITFSGRIGKRRKEEKLEACRFHKNRESKILGPSLGTVRVDVSDVFHPRVSKALHHLLKRGRNPFKSKPF